MIARSPPEEVPHESPEWIRKLIEAAKPIVPAGFVGHVEIDVSKDGISHVTIRQEWSRTKGGAA